MKINDTIYDKMKIIYFLWIKIFMDKSNYLTEKQASVRYGKSQSWFQKKRHHKLPPLWIKFEGKRTIYYSIAETDKWFYENMKIIEL
jgi:hypothetical protein